LPRGPQQLHSGGLRRLGNGEGRAVHGLHHQIALDAFHRLGDGDRRDRRSMLRGCGRHRGDEGGPDDGSGAVVDQDHPLARGIQCAHAREHGLLPPPATGHHRDDRGVEPRSVGHLGYPLWRGHDDDTVDLGRCRQGVDGPGQERPAADRRRQLVAPVHPAALPGGHDHGVDTLTGRPPGDRTRPVDRQSTLGWAKIIRPATV
jgi:hypothetical protein